jgi:PKD repeat protein
MRKLYALLAGLCLALSATVPARAQQPANDLANFTFAIDAATNNVVFTNTSVLGSLPGVRRAHWSFGDGAHQWTAPLQNTEHHYAVAGTYTVCLQIFRFQSNTNDSVLAAQVCKTLTIEQICRANFEFRDSLVSTNPLKHIVRFWALPFHNANKRVTEICWKFGDGTDTCISYGPNTPAPNNLSVQHTYYQQGPYNVCIRIKYDGGCVAEKCKTVAFQNPPPDSCRAEFERLPLTSANNPLSVIYKAFPSHNLNKKPKTICWTFGDGRDTCINYPENYTALYTVPHTYREPGLYEVCVKILYYGGCEARKCKPIQIARPDSCTADFERIPVATANNSLQTAFRALPWHNNNKKPKRICWVFGDGRDTCINYGEDYSGPFTVGHRYEHPGQYEVCVKISYYGGCESRKCKPVVIPHDTCAVRLHEISPSITSLVRGFYAAVTSLPPSRVVRICWNFGDGTDTCINATNTDQPDLLIRHTYPAPGVYRVCVRTLFANGCRAEDCREVVIRSYNNTCGGYMTDSLTGPRSFLFRGHSIHSPNDQVVSYRWTFGDGSSAVGREVSHTYNNAGDFDVCLYIKTALGCETRICKKVRVPGNNQPALVVTPNPVHDVLHALFFSTHAEPVTIKLINQNGVVIRSVTKVAVVGPNQWDFEVANLLPGLYSLVVQSPNQQASVLFIKI